MRSKFGFQFPLRYSAIALVIALFSASIGQGQTMDYPQPCPKCGKVHAVTTNTVPQPTTSVAQTAWSAPEVYSSQRVAISAPVTSTAGSLSGTSNVSSGIRNVLSRLNAQRSRQGLRSLRYDSSLQAVAERRARLMASTGTKSHPPGSFAPGRYEGVGWSSSFSPSGVHACYTSDPNMTSAGAAMAQGSDGMYFVVVYR